MEQQRNLKDCFNRNRICIPLHNDLGSSVGTQARSSECSEIRLWIVCSSPAASVLAYVLFGMANLRLLRTYGNLPCPLMRLVSDPAQSSAELKFHPRHGGRAVLKALPWAPGQDPAQPRDVGRSKCHRALRPGLRGIIHSCHIGFAVGEFMH